MLWNVSDCSEERCPFFRRDYVHNRAFALPEPLQAGEETIKDPLRVFTGKYFALADDGVRGVPDIVA